jgi:hypothetical protein
LPALAKAKGRGEIIKERLLGARVILFMVSRDFLASKYITEHERPLAMRLMAADRAVIVPVLLSACSWRDEDFAKLEKLPRKDDAISSFSPRENGWALVEEGLKAAVERARRLSDLRKRRLGGIPAHRFNVAPEKANS